MNAYPTVYRNEPGWTLFPYPWRCAAWSLDAGNFHMASLNSGRIHEMPKPDETIYQYFAQLLNGQPLRLDSLRGQVVLIVNTASRCGFTPQYAGLEQLYQAYRARGFTVLAFPCSQFGGQEPGSAGEIAAFCETKYRVTFPIFARIDVNGRDAHPLYSFLKRSKPGLLSLFGVSRIRWNFAKFLIDKEGRVAARFGSSTAPKALKARIEALLGPGTTT